MTTMAREFSKGAFWFSDCCCLSISINGRSVHNHNSCYLLIGREKTIMIDTGPQFAWERLLGQLERALNGRRLDYIYPTHPEAPHMGNLFALLEEYPEAQLVGDVRNYALYAPEAEGRMRNLKLGENIDLGDLTLRTVFAAVHDLPNTLWAYCPELGILYVSDGFPYIHDHDAGQCSLLSSELNHMPSPADTKNVIEGALGWTRHVPAELTIQKLRPVLHECPPKFIAPAHGNVIDQPEALLSVFIEGLRNANSRTTCG